MLGQLVVLNKIIINISLFNSIGETEKSKYLVKYNR